MTATIPAKNPFSLVRLNKIRPIDNISNNIPAKDIYIFNIGTDIFSPQFQTLESIIAYLCIGISQGLTVKNNK